MSMSIDTRMAKGKGRCAAMSKLQQIQCVFQPIVRFALIGSGRTIEVPIPREDLNTNMTHRVSFSIVLIELRASITAIADNFIPPKRAQLSQHLEVQVKCYDYASE